MTTSVKGILKGLRYISQIFDEEEEKEIQIGFPTDVKHVAHIGSDDSSQTAPTWMNGFKDQPDSPKKKKDKPKPLSEEVKPNKKQEGKLEDKGDSNKTSKVDLRIRNLIPRTRHNSIDSSEGERKKEGSEATGTKQRRHRSSDSASETSRHHRRHSNQGTELSESSLSQDKPPATTKHGHRRRSKTSSSSEEGSVSGKTSKPRRSSKGDSLSDISLSDLGSGLENGQGSK